MLFGYKYNLIIRFASQVKYFASSYKMYTETFLIFMFCVSNVIIKSNKIFLFQFYDCIIRHKRFLPTNVNARTSALLIFLAHFGHDVSLSVRMTSIGDMLHRIFLFEMRYLPVCSIVILTIHIHEHIEVIVTFVQTIKNFFTYKAVIIKIFVDDSGESCHLWCVSISY